MHEIAKAEGHDASEDGTGRGVPLVAETLTANGDAHSGYRDEKGLIPVGINGGELRAGDSVPAVAFNWQSGGDCRGLELKSTAQTLTKEQTPAALSEMAVRRLTPRECERLQGFPDDYTLIPWRGKTADECPDGPRYKAIGNSMATPVMHWIGKRIASVEAIISRENSAA